MKETPEKLALQQAFTTCESHEDALRDALGDLSRRNLVVADLDSLSKDDRRLLDQFAYRYTRLQDDMGARLFPAVLRAQQENVSAMPVIDRLNRLEQLLWLPSADEWADLRRVRNEFTHEYPEAVEERFGKLMAAIASANRIIEIFDIFKDKWEEGEMQKDEG